MSRPALPCLCPLQALARHYEGVLQEPGFPRDSGIGHHAGEGTHRRAVAQGDGAERECTARIEVANDGTCIVDADAIAHPDEVGLDKQQVRALWEQAAPLADEATQRAVPQDQPRLFFGHSRRLYEGGGVAAADLLL